MVTSIPSFRSHTKNFLSSERGGAEGVGARGKGSGRCERQVDLSSTSLLASATRVSHGMQWHQVFSEHADKKGSAVLLGRAQLAPQIGPAWKKPRLVS